MVHADHLGRPIRMTDATKTTVWAATYKPLGEVQSISGTRSNNLRLPGQVFQIETNLAYNWHRHYDPVTGRYTQPDPLRFVDGPSVYEYVGNSPAMRTDRSGLKATPDEFPHSPIPPKPEGAPDGEKKSCEVVGICVGENDGGNRGGQCIYTCPGGSLKIIYATGGKCPSFVLH